jgi:bifunctional DNase/RNase
VIPLKVVEVQPELPSATGLDAGMVVLGEQPPPFRLVRIVIGQHEARAIQAAWQGATPGRPSTWDLFVAALAVLGARIDRIVITAVEESRHFYANLELDHGGERRVLSCRPSDGLALAVRAFNAEILCEEAVLDAAGVLPEN